MCWSWGGLIPQVDVFSGEYQEFDGADCAGEVLSGHTCCSDIACLFSPAHPVRVENEEEANVEEEPGDTG